MTKNLYFIFDWVKINCPLNCEEEDSWEFLYNLRNYLSFSQYVNVLHNLFLWCNDHQVDHHSLLTKNVTSLLYFFILFQRRNCWLSALQANNVILHWNMWDLEMLINVKWSSTFLRIKTNSTTWKPFQIVQGVWCFSGKTDCRSRGCRFELHPLQVSGRWNLKYVYMPFADWEASVIAAVTGLKRIADVLE